MLWMVLWLACAGVGVEEPPARSPEAPPATEPAPAEPDVSDLPPPAEPRYAASHILVAYDGAVRSEATRSRSDALALAHELHTRAETEDFATLAKEHSDGPSAARGGQLGVYATGTMVPDFENRMRTLEKAASADALNAESSSRLLLAKRPLSLSIGTRLGA